MMGSHKDLVKRKKELLSTSKSFTLKDLSKNIKYL